MTSDDIFRVIDQIARTSSKNDKQALVSANIGDPEFKRVLVAALDPLTTYGMAKRPVLEGITIYTPGRQFDAPTWQILDDLAARRLTGNNAIDTVRGEMAALTVESAELFWRIIAKDLRAGFSESTVNKAAKGTIREFPYMRCSLPKDAKMDEWGIETNGAISQEKADGMFLNVTHETGGLVSLTTRQGTPFPLDAMPALVAEIQARLKPDTQTHSEMLVLIDGKVAPREISNGILNSIAQGGTFEANQQPLLKVWDQIPLAAVVPKGKHTVPYRDRLADLFKQLHAVPGTSICAIDTRIVKSISEAFAHYREYIADGKEGTILKRMTAIWRDGTSKEQVKLKLEVDVDLKVVAIVPGRAGTKNEGRAGSLTCVTSCGQLKTDVTVKDEKMRDEVDANPNDWIERVITVRANSIMTPSASSDLHSLFLPRMVEACYRLDKTEPDSLERVRDQFNAAVKAA